MFSRKYRRSLQHLGHMHSGDMSEMMKIAAAGFIAYQAAKYVIREVMD